MDVVHDAQLDWMRCFAESPNSRDAFANMRMDTLRFFEPLLHDPKAAAWGADLVVTHRWQKIVRRELQRRRVPS